MRYCKSCGSEITDDETNRFCGQCGVPLEAMIRSEQLPSVPMQPPARAMQPTPINAHDKDGAHTSIKRAKLKKPTGGIIAIVSSGLAFLLFFNLVIGPAISGKTIFDRFKDKNRIIMEDSIDVSAEQTIVEISGITIDVNPLNLNDSSEKLTVKKYSPTVGEDGFLGEEYDISLGEEHYLLAPMTIGLPYDPDTAKDSLPCILHYDNDYDAWIPQYSQIDTKNSMVTAKLTSLSPVRLVYFDKDYQDSLYYISNADSINARFEVSYNYWSTIQGTSLEPALIIAQDYLANGNTVASTSQILHTADTAIDTLSTYSNLFGNLGEATFGALGHISDELKLVGDKASNSIGVVSLIITGGQLAFDLATKESTGPRNETAINLYKNLITDSGTIYGFATGYSSALFSLSFFGVALFGIGLDYAVTGAQTIQADTIKAVFDTYYSEHTSFNERDWYKIFVDAYWHAWQNDRNSQDAMDIAIKSVTDAINVHAEKFWSDIYREGSDALTFAVAEAGVRNYYTPTAEQKTELVENFKAEMFKRFNEKAIPWINEFMLERIQGAVFSSLQQATAPYNRYYRIQIQETAPEDSDEECKFQMCPIYFGTDEGFVDTPFPKQWQLLAPKEKQEWATRLDVTLLGYLMAGGPDKVFVFDAWDEDKRFGDEIETRTLSLAAQAQDYTTVIDLSGRAESAYVWALTSIKGNDDLGSLESGIRTGNGIYDMEVNLSVSGEELTIQIAKETANGLQSAQARLNYTTMIMPDTEGGLTASAAMISSTFIDHKDEFTAFAFVEYQDPLGYKSAAAREPGTEASLTVGPLPSPGDSVQAGMMVRRGQDTHIVEVGIGYADGLGIPPRYGVILTYTWMPYDDAVKTKPQIG